MEFYTIGVYNTSEKEFFDKLTENKIDTFCDIRQRRGVRGAKYSFVNSNKLQEKLIELEIRYSHIINLAPNDEIRNLQKEEDLHNGKKKSERDQLGEVFTSEYKNRILNKFDIDIFLEQLDNVGAKRIVFFCVENHANACHRSIVAKKLEEVYNYRIIHL